jgi:hypothetical protein
MAVVKPKETGISKGRIARAVLTDIGVDFNIADTILFAASTNALGMGACLTALGVSALSKMLSVSQTGFAANYPRLAQIILDSKTPLLTNAAAMLTLGAVALVKGDWIPALSGFIFAVGDLRLAQSLESAALEKSSLSARSAENGGDHPQSVFKRALSLLVRRSDIYFSAGFAISGLMAGGAAVWAMPVIAVATGIALRNAVQNKPEYAGHPKIISALARSVTVAAGIAGGNWLPTIAYVIYAVLLVDVECKITPGGGRQILRDIKTGVTDLCGGAIIRRHDNRCTKQSRRL